MAWPVGFGGGSYGSVEPVERGMRSMAGTSTSSGRAESAGLSATDDATSALERRVGLVNRTATVVGLTGALSKLPEAEQRRRELIEAGMPEAAWRDSMGTAAEVLFEGVMSLPNKLGAVMGISVNVVGAEAANQAGRAVADATLKPLNELAWWMHDNGLSDGRAPRLPRPK